MLGSSQRLQQIVREPHTAISLVEVYREGLLRKILLIHDGEVDADKTAKIRRRFTANLADPDGTLTPETAFDLLAPFGTEIRVYRGVEYTDVTTVERSDSSQQQLSEGTLNGVAVNDDGELVLV